MSETRRRPEGLPEAEANAPTLLRRAVDAERERDVARADARQQQESAVRLALDLDQRDRELDEARAEVERMRAVIAAYCAKPSFAGRAALEALAAEAP